MLSSACGSITHTYLYPQVNKGQPRTLALVLIWDWSVCFLGGRGEGMMPPATSPQGGKGCSSTMASFHLKDSAKWIQLSCKKETLRQSSGAPMSPVPGHTIPSPGASCTPGQQCSPPHRVPTLMDFSSLLPLARERWQGMGSRQGAHLPVGERRKPCCCFCNRGSVPSFTHAPVPIGHLHPQQQQHHQQ